MMRFKYSFTLWVEENGLALFVLPPAIAFTVAPMNSTRLVEGSIILLILLDL
jgi:hypothetical protein